jgi:hypothetical protein
MPQRASVIDISGNVRELRSVHYVNRTFAFAGMTPAMAKADATVADAVYSGGVALHAYESTAFYKLSQVIFAAFFDVVLFALTILIFALETTSPVFPEQAFAMVNFDPVSTVLAFSPFCWLGY